jgi:sterol 3beta-glucosyltransferase
MNVTILTVGSRGDVEPYLALAVGLQKSGHEVTIAAPAAYAEWIHSFGVKSAVTRFDAGELMARRQRKEAGSGSRNPWGTGQEASGIISDYDAASKGADLILQTGIAWGGIEVARVNNAAVAFAYPFPVTHTREFPVFHLAFRRSFGGAYNLWTHRVAQRIAWRVLGKVLTGWRSEHGLSKLRSLPEMLDQAPAKGAPTLYLFSPSVLPKPADWPATDHVTGYWFLPAPAAWQPSRELQDFLDSGPRPVLVGFGSMGAPHAERRTLEVVRALEESGNRGIVVTGGGRALARVNAPSSVMFIDNAPFSYLFPRMSAVVHHGGASTTATALRAGVPSVIMPVGFDQFAWSHTIEKLGLGVHGGMMARLNAKRLSRSISTVVNDATFRNRAVAMADRIGREDGVAKAVEILERHMASVFSKRYSPAADAKDHASQ